jgi:tight adherence protein C
MPVPLVPLLAVIVTASAFGALIGLLVVTVGHRPTPASGSPATGEVAVVLAPRVPLLVRLMPKGYRSMLERQILLAGRPSTWTIGRMAVLKPLFALVLGVAALCWYSMDPAPFRLGIGVFAVALGFFTPDLLVYSRGVERQQ